MALDDKNQISELAEMLQNMENTVIPGYRNQLNTLVEAVESGLEADTDTRNQISKLSQELTRSHMVATIIRGKIANLKVRKPHLLP